MEPSAETTASLEMHEGAQVLVEDEDLLSHDAQASLARMADAMGVLLVAAFFFGALKTKADGQLRRRVADSVVGALPGGAVWRRLLRLEHPLTVAQSSTTAARGVRAGLNATTWNAKTEVET